MMTGDSVGQFSVSDRENMVGSLGTHRPVLNLLITDLVRFL